jgi:O-antigen ligase/tetratricopeptide (TPR) repeat protein
MLNNIRLVKWYKALLGLATITPLVMATGGFYPFLVPKALFFRTLTALSVALFFFLWARGVITPRTEILKNKISWLPAIFLVIAYIASIQGVNFYHSFWSLFDRMEGLVGLTHLVSFFYLLLLSFNKDDFKKIFTVGVWVSGVVAIIALMEWQHLLPFLESQGVDRPAGTIGNPAFLASYLLLMMPFSYYFARIAKTPFQKYAYYTLAGLSLFTIIATGTRGAFVALIAGALSLLGWYFIYAQSKETKKIAGVIFLLFIVVGGIFYVTRDSFKESSIDIVRRTANISLEDETTRSRVFIWQNTLPYIFERPIFGYGLENFEYVYNKIYDPSVISEEWFDRSHNVYVDLLVHTGILGAGAYLFFIGGIGYAIFSLRRQDEVLAASLLFLLVAYVTQNFFIFDTVNTSIFFFAVGAFILVYTKGEGGLRHIRETAEEIKTSLLGNRYSFQKQGVFYGVSLLALLSIFWSTVQPIRANSALSEGYEYQVADVARSLSAWEQGLALGTFAETDYGYQAYDAYFNRRGTQGLSAEAQTASYAYTKNLLEALIKKYPHSARFYVYLGHVYDEPVAGEVVSVEDFSVLLKKAIELSPKRKQPHYMLANTHLRKMDTTSNTTQKMAYLEEGASVLKEYIKAAPNFAEPKIILANLYRNNGKITDADFYLEEALKVYTPSVSVAQRIVTYLIAEKDYARVEPFLEFIAHETPGDFGILFDLAHVYEFNGKREEARDAILIIQQYAPQILERDKPFVDSLLQN